MNKVWIVTTPSAYRANHVCFLGKGASKQAALEDAYGPREDWSKSTKAAIKCADVYEVSEDEARDMEGRN